MFKRSPFEHKGAFCMAAGPPNHMEYQRLGETSPGVSFIKVLLLFH